MCNGIDKTNHASAPCLDRIAPCLHHDGSDLQESGLTPPTQVTPDNAVLVGEGGEATASARTCTTACL